MVCAKPARVSFAALFVLVATSFGCGVNLPPVANAGPDQVVPRNAPVSLDGTGSTDANGDALSHSWSFYSRPAGSTAGIFWPATATPYFTPDVPGNYVLELVVYDWELSSSPDQVTITAVNQAPTADPGADMHTMVNVPVTLDGTASSDPDGDALFYQWSFLSMPVGSLAALSDPTSATPSFTPDLGGDYLLSLVVDDGYQSGPTATVTVTAHKYIDVLDYDVVDAEYSRGLERIIMVSEAPNQLHIYDPATEADTAVDLPLAPTCVSVGPGGLDAAVGHDAWISYVDLASAALVKTFSVSTNPCDIVLAGNGYVHAFPAADQWVNIRSVEIATETEYMGAGIRAGTLAKLHPSGTSAYGADNGLSPSDIEKYDLVNGPAAYLYDSPYHGDYSMGGNLWMSEDGLRIFTRSGNVFRASDARAEDMTYNGTLSDLGSVASLAHSAAIDKVVAIPRPGWSTPDADAEIQLYDYSFLVFQGGTNLPYFIANSQWYVSHGKFVFPKSDGSEWYVIVQADDSAGVANDYGVVVYDLSELDGGGSDPQASIQGSGDSSSILGHRVVDAEYSKQLDRIVTVCSSPAELHIYDPVSDQDTAVPLLLAPTCVSVSPDGSYAAVGHDAWISYVDLASAALVKTFSVSTNPCDIVLAGNGYVHAFPAAGQWVNILSVEIATETEYVGAGIRAGTRAKLHPSDTSAYGADNGLSPSDIEKYDITGGTAAYLYDSPYHGDYGMGGNLWISDDGLKVFVRAGNVFTSSDVQSQDMLYNGSLSNLTTVRYLNHSSAVDKVAAIPSGSTDTEVQLYDYAFLAYETSIQLPSFVVDASSYDGHGTYVFFRSDGSKYYVLIQADSSSGILHDFGVVTYTY